MKTYSYILTRGTTFATTSCKFSWNVNPLMGLLSKENSLLPLGAYYFLWEWGTDGKQKSISHEMLSTLKCVSIDLRRGNEDLILCSSFFDFAPTQYVLYIQCQGCVTLPHRAQNTSKIT